MKYSGQKAVNNWIKENLFLIHEYANSRNADISKTITDSLIKTLSGKRKKIKIECTTKLGDWVRIEYNPNKLISGRATILIDKKTTINNIY